MPTRGIVWFANVACAAAFAGSHLPSWSGASVGLATWVFVLNFVAGLVMGYVFVTRGISSAMWAHAGGDCAIQLIGPLSR